MARPPPTPAASPAPQEGLPSLLAILHCALDSVGPGNLLYGPWTQGEPERPTGQVLVLGVHGGEREEVCAPGRHELLEVP